MRSFLLLLFIISQTIFASSNGLKYSLSGSSNWVPYYIPNKATPGIVGEFIPLVLSEADIAGVEINFPPKRTNQALKNGDLDFDTVCAEWFPDQNVGPEFVLSEPFLTVKEYFVTLKSGSVENKVVGTNIGTLLGYYYYDDNSFHRIDFKSEKELVLALKKERIERVLIGDLTASYWSKKLNIPLELQQLHTQGELRIRFHKQKQHLLPKINAAIQSLKKNGTVNNIVEKYTRLYQGNLASANAS